MVNKESQLWQQKHSYVAMWVYVSFYYSYFQISGKTGDLAFPFRIGGQSFAVGEHNRLVDLKTPDGLFSKLWAASKEPKPVRQTDEDRLFYN